MSELLLAEQRLWDQRHCYMEVANDNVNRTQQQVAIAALKFIDKDNDFITWRSEVAPDLAMCRSRLIYEFKLDPTPLITKAPMMNGQDIHNLMTRANGNLASYLNIRTRSDDSPLSQIMMATTQLEHAAQGIVDHYKSAGFTDTLEDLHRKRMEQP